MTYNLDQRLRYLGERLGKCQDQYTVIEAADELARLRAENERLRAEAVGMNCFLEDARTYGRGRIEALEAALTKARHAFQVIDGCGDLTVANTVARDTFAALPRP